MRQDFAPRASDPGPEPIHPTDIVRARLERRLITGGFGILLGLAVLFLLIQCGGLAAIAGGVVIVGGALLLALVWIVMLGIEWLAHRPGAND